MHIRWTLRLVLVVVGCTLVSAAVQSANGAAYAGTWSGTWDGAGSGQFELTLDNAADGAPVGRVAVTTDGGNYTAELKSITYDGNRLTAKYEFPLDPSAEVSLDGRFEGAGARGAWSLRPKGQDTEVAGGTWTVSRK